MSSPDEVRAATLLEVELQQLQAHVVQLGLFLKLALQQLLQLDVKILQLGGWWPATLVVHAL